MKSWVTGAVMVICVAGCERVPTSPPPPAPPVPVKTEAAKPAMETPPPAPIATTPTPEPLAQAQQLKAAGKLAEARDLLTPLADTGSDALMELLSDINTQIIFSPVPAPQKADYAIAAGDSLAKIAKQFSTTIELIKKSNNLTSDLIRTGNRLRIYQGQFAVSVSKSANTLTLTDHGKFFKRYRVGTGEYSKTPVGEFKITVRQEKPVWHRGDKIVPFGDPENILGTHWLGLDVVGYGIHGTWQTNSIGKAATAGCVRMLNDQVAELYTILPTGTPVSIHD